MCSTLAAEFPHVDRAIFERVIGGKIERVGELFGDAKQRILDLPAHGTCKE